MTGDAHLGVPAGGPGSGRARYGVAMGLFQDGRLSAAQLEAYRIAAADDAGDPAVVLAERGLPLPRATPADAARALRHLLDEAGRYIATLTGPGIAEVRQGLAPAWGQQPQARAAAANPVVAAHLDTALAALRQTHAALAHAIAAALPHQAWLTYDVYPADRIGPEFARSHAYATLIGAEGNFPSDEFDFGLFLIAPHVLYRDHHHVAPELYAPLTGPHGWRFGPGRPLSIKPAHVPVWNPPHRPHLTKVGPVPFLCLYAWTRDCDAVAEVLPAPDWPALEAMRLG